MQPTPNRDMYGNPSQAATASTFMSKVYMWMTIGILLTGFVAMNVATNETLFTMILGNKIVFYGLMIAEFALVIGLSAAINRLSAFTATALFLLYATLNGATLSAIGLIYTAQSIQGAFFTTAFSFAGLSAFGFFTKRDLGPVGNFCSMGLFGLIGMAILSIFFPSLMGGVGGQVYGLVGIVVFAGLTAYDTQNIKNMAPNARDIEGSKKGAIMGALKLYLDFINLFLFILRLGGNRK
jgi:FtsH-binding integral membrane protein